MDFYQHLYEQPEETVGNIENGFECIDERLSEGSQENDLEDITTRYKVLWDNLERVKEYVKNENDIEGAYFVPGNQSEYVDFATVNVDGNTTENDVPPILGRIHNLKKRATEIAGDINCRAGSEELGSDYRMISGGLARKDDED
jgi:hypothetical protein